MEDALGIRVPEDEVAELCRSHHIKRLSFFGSVLGKDFTDESDVDVLVEFEVGKKPGYLGMARLAEELSQMLGNRKADVRTPDELSRYFRDDVVSHARVAYAGG